MHKYLFIVLLTASFAQVSDYAYMGAEATALAGANVSQRGGSESIYHNPAGIAEINTIRFYAGGGNLYGFNWLTAYHMSGIIPITGIGHIGFSIQQLETKYGEITLSTEQTISMAQGFNLQKDKNSHLAIGYTVNFVQWNLGNSAGINGNGSEGFELGSVKSVTIDFGVLASLRKKYRFGVFMKNINSGALGKGMTRQVLPRRINAGITYMPISGLSTSFVTESLLGRDDLQIKGAIHYSLNPFLELYTGAQSNPNRLGFGLKLSRGNLHNIAGKKLVFTYGLLTHPVLPMTQQISIGF